MNDVTELIIGENVEFVIQVEASGAGPKGDPGVTGEQGPPGIQGEIGPQGPPGEPANTNEILKLEDFLTYELPATFIGNGIDAFIDTNIPLYQSSDRDWTMCIQLNTTVPSGDKVYVSCFSELYPNYYGFLMRHSDDNTIDFVLGHTVYYSVPCQPDTDIWICVKKQFNTYKIYKNGILQHTCTSYCPNYLGNLLLGCQDSDTFNKMRFSAATIYKFKAYAVALSDEKIAMLCQ